MKGFSAILFGMIFACHFQACAAEQAWPEKREFWFTQPAMEWKLGLPAGNGRLGAMVAGTFPKERRSVGSRSVSQRT
jgi:hypothetical protein